MTMIVGKLYQPKTGADSVPIPEPSDRPHDPAWSKYWDQRQQAEREETVEQAIERCRGQAGEWERHRHFDGTFAMLLDTFDTTVGIEQYAGLGLDECGFFSRSSMDGLRKHWAAMAHAFDAGDRAAYSKAAADFARDAAIFSAGVVEAHEGGAA
jgi:hypothetical protein